MEYFTKVSELGDQANVEEANNILCPPVVTVNQWCEAHVTNINK
jgi:hypothetical protein